ncbi:hypothetical protein CerSpe_041580 [Prunus speciosa]
MEVSNEVEAYNLCNSYALKKGFSIRKGNIRRDTKNNIRQRDYLCSKQGFYDDFGQVKTAHKLDTRTGCMARIRFTVEDKVWKISHINLDHNHECAKPEERQFLKSGRKIRKVHANVMSSMVEAGIRPTKSYSYLAKEVGGAENVGFTKKDCLNYLHRKKEEMIEGGDAQSLINHFKYKQAEDPNFFYSVQVDQFTRMTNFFWRDGRSKLDYDCFGDVICFDTTFRTNKYNLICAPFVGINHHWKNVSLGCAFLLDESTKSFVWLLQTFLESMGNKHPITIFTDEDKAMANAIEIVFPQTRHRLCTWHIAKNATQPLAGLYTNPEFSKQFNKCFYGCFSESEFEATWDNMINTFKLENHSWLQKLYSLRKKWCSAFNLDYFSANIRATQRVESTNNIFHQISTKCKLFESKGLLCRHALKVFDSKNITSLPSQYILKRWTKGVKKEIVVSSDLCESSNKKEKSVQSLRLSELMHEVNDVVSIASFSDSGTRLVKQKLAEVKLLLERDMETTRAKKILNNIDDQNVHDVVSDKPPVLNPPTIRAKGITNARIKSNMEKKRKKDKRKDARVGNSSQVSRPTTVAASQPEQEIISGPPHSTHYNPFVHQFGDISSPIVGHPNFRFTSMLQGSDQMTFLSQDSSRTLNENFAYGPSSNLSQDLYFNGFNQFRGC